jgi:hypothetical protein
VADIDELLKGSFDRLAEPADSAGVADLIRARVAAGDAGTTVASTTAPGWKAPTPKWFWPLLGTVTGLAVIVVILLVLVFGSSAAEPEPTDTPTPSVTPTPTPTPTPTVTPTPTPMPTEDEEEPPPPPPPPVDNAPTIQQISANPAEVYCESGSTISVIASDDKNVQSVTLTWNGPSSGNASMSLQGGIWSSYILMQSGEGTYTITAVAKDSAGQSSAPAMIGVYRGICIT